MSNEFSDKDLSQPMPGDPYSAAPQRKQSRIWLWVLVGVVGGGLACMAVCCGVMYFGWGMLSEAIGKEVTKEFAGHPDVKENIGEIQSCELSLEASQRRGAQGGTMVFIVKGTKGEGQLIVTVDQTQRRGQEVVFNEALLEMENGDSFDLLADPVEPE